MGGGNKTLLPGVVSRGKGKYSQNTVPKVRNTHYIRVQQCCKIKEKKQHDQQSK